MVAVRPAHRPARAVHRRPGGGRPRRLPAGVGGACCSRVNAVAFVLDGILIGAGDMRFLAWAMVGCRRGVRPRRRGGRGARRRHRLAVGRARAADGHPGGHARPCASPATAGWCSALCADRDPTRDRATTGTQRAHPLCENRRALAVERRRQAAERETNRERRRRSSWRSGGGPVGDAVVMSALVGAGAALAAGFALLQVLDRRTERRRRAERARRAAERGWRLHAGGGSWATRWAGHPFGAETRPVATDVMTGRFPPHDAVVFDLAYGAHRDASRSSGRRRARHGTMPSRRSARTSSRSTPSSCRPRSPGCTCRSRAAPTGPPSPWAPVTSRSRATSSTARIASMPRTRASPSTS